MHVCIACAAAMSTSWYHVPGISHHTRRDCSGVLGDQASVHVQSGGTFKVMPVSRLP